MQKMIPFLLLVCLAIGCKNSPNKRSQIPFKTLEGVKYANGFIIQKSEGYTELTITNPWPESDKVFKYLLVEDPNFIPNGEDYDAVISVPIKKIVVTSTTHIPSLEMLGVENKLIGFPNLNYISSPKTRGLVDSGKIQELGKNEDLNTEILIDHQPDVVVTFAIEGQNTTVSTLERAGIPIIYNSDWTETHPLGKAEWIKFFGVLFGLEEKAEEQFKLIEKEYLAAKELALDATKSPTVLSGAMYKDVWYLPQGDSWAAKFIEDANGTYLWGDREGTGSLALNVESVLERAQFADYWIGPSQFTQYQQLLDANAVYDQFEAFRNKTIYTFTLKKGATGGVIYYELAPNRPDLVLKDLIKILHPELLPSHELYFFSPLE